MRRRNGVTAVLLLCYLLVPAVSFGEAGFQTGSVTNNCNGEVYLTFVSRTGQENSKTVMPGQSVPVPEDTIEVKAELLNDVYGDETTSVDITMPDGSSHMLQSLPGSARIPGQN